MLYLSEEAKVHSPTEFIGTIAYFTSVWIAKLATGDFRKNRRNTEAGTRTASPNKSVLFKLRQGLVYNFEGDFFERAERKGGNRA